MWTVEENQDSASASFSAILEKDNATKGSFEADYDFFATSFKIIKCPYVIVSKLPDSDNDKISITNSFIDLSNWRALLLAVAVMNSKVKDIFIHNSNLTSQHLMDLSITLQRQPNVIKYITIKYTEMNFSQDEVGNQLFIDALKLLCTDTNQLEYLTLQAISLTDSLLEKVIPLLHENMKLKVINLSNNRLSSSCMCSLLAGLRYTGNLQAISFAYNNTSSFPSSQDQQRNLLKTVFELVTPALPAAAGDDGQVKAINKTIGEKNKVMKDLNKKRKKAGYLIELEEFASLPEMIKPMMVEGGGTAAKEKMFCNPTIKLIDLSGCAAITVSGNELLEMIQRNYWTSSVHVQLLQQEVHFQAILRGWLAGGGAGSADTKEEKAARQMLQSKYGGILAFE